MFESFLQGFSLGAVFPDDGLCLGAILSLTLEILLEHEQLLTQHRRLRGDVPVARAAHVAMVMVRADRWAS